MTTMQDAERIGKQVSEMAKEIEDGRAEYQEAMHALGQAGVPWAEHDGVQLNLLGRIRWMAKRWNEAEQSRGSLVTQLATAKAAHDFVVAQLDGVEEAMRHVREELGMQTGESIIATVREMKGRADSNAANLEIAKSNESGLAKSYRAAVARIHELEGALDEAARRTATDLGRMIRDGDFASRLESPETMSDGELLATLIAQAERDRTAVKGLLNEVDRAIPQEARDAALQVSGQIQTAMRMTAEKAREEWQRERATLVAQLQLVREALGCQDGDDVVEMARGTQQGKPADYIDIVFDGPPDADGGRFVEVEDKDGKSIKFGEWVEDKGRTTFGVPVPLWRLRIPRTTYDTAKIASLTAALESMTKEHDAARTELDRLRRDGSMSSSRLGALADGAAAMQNDIDRLRMENAELESKNAGLAKAIEHMKDVVSVASKRVDDREAEMAMLHGKLSSALCVDGKSWGELLKEAHRVTLASHDRDAAEESAEGVAEMIERLRKQRDEALTRLAVAQGELVSAATLVVQERDRIAAEAMTAVKKMADAQGELAAVARMRDALAVELKVMRGYVKDGREFRRHVVAAARGWGAGRSDALPSDHTIIGDVRELRESRVRLAGIQREYAEAVAALGGKEGDELVPLAKRTLQAMADAINERNRLKTERSEALATLGGHEVASLVGYAQAIRRELTAAVATLGENISTTEALRREFAQILGVDEDTSFHALRTATLEMSRKLAKAEESLSAWRKASTMGSGGGGSGSGVVLIDSGRLADGKFGGGGGSGSGAHVVISDEKTALRALEWVEGLKRGTHQAVDALPDVPERVVELTCKARPLTDQELHDLQCPAAEQGRCWYVMGDALFLGHLPAPDFIPKGTIVESALARMRAIHERSLADIKARPFEFLHGLGYRMGGSEVTINASQGDRLSAEVSEALGNIDGAIARLSAVLTGEWPTARYATQHIDTLVDVRLSVSKLPETVQRARDDVFSRAQRVVETALRQTFPTADAQSEP